MFLSVSFRCTVVQMALFSMSGMKGSFFAHCIDQLPTVDVDCELRVFVTLRSVRTSQFLKGIYWQQCPALCQLVDPTITALKQLNHSTGRTSELPKTGEGPQWAEVRPPRTGVTPFPVPLDN
jgi:hypothetical protein